MPPAPTKPSTVAPRTLISKRSSVKVAKLASTCGSAAKRTVCTQDAPTARRPSTGFMSMFSVVSKNCLPSAPALWMRDRQHAGQRAEAEGDDEDQREHDVRHGPAEFEPAPRGEHDPARCGQIGRGEEVEREGEDGAGQRADIGHQQRLADQPQQCA